MRYSSATIAFLPLLLTALGAAPTRAAYVLPQMGGGAVGQGQAPMKHADITLNGSSIEVHVDDSVPAPVLRMLEPPDEFDPLQPWAVLSGKHYNFQFGWNPGGFFLPPAGAWIWIEQIAATPGLETYQRPPASPAYQPIFGTLDSALRWRWSGAMTHNAYAVLDPQLGRYEATYRVYLGDDVAGTPWPEYHAAEVTFSFAVELPPTADYSDDGLVDGTDLLFWQRNVGLTAFLTGDGNHDAVVDAADLALWKVQYGGIPANRHAALAVPEPRGLSQWLAVIACSLLTVLLRRQRPTLEPHRSATSSRGGR